MASSARSFEGKLELSVRGDVNAFTVIVPRATRIDQLKTVLKPDVPIPLGLMALFVCADSHGVSAGRALGADEILGAIEDELNGRIYVKDTRGAAAAGGAGGLVGGAEGASPSGKGEDDLLGMLRSILTNTTLVASRLDKVETAAKLQHLDKLLIKPIYSPPSAGSSRSPRKHERQALKVATIGFYGLWKNGDPSSNLVVPMLAPAGRERAALPMGEVILAHILPSTQHSETPQLGSLLGLPEGFQVQPRNFLLLPAVAETAFDCDVLLLLPGKQAVTPHAPTATVRVLRDRLSRLPPNVRPEDVLAYDGAELYLPRAGNMPFMRLLGWKAVSAIRELQEGVGVPDVPTEIDLAASVSIDPSGTPVAGLVCAVQKLKEYGARFRRL